MKKFIASIAICVVGLCLLFTTSAPITQPNQLTSQKLNDRLMSGKNVLIDRDFGNVPLYFIFNKGQVNNKAIFYAKASKYSLWLTSGGIIFDSFKHDHINNTSTQPSSSLNAPQSTHLQRDVSRLIFLNANKNPDVIPIGDSPLKVSYFIGQDKSRWYGDIPTSKAVLYTDVYPGVDLKVYGLEKKIEYDWVVKPGANPSDIRIQYQNVIGTRLDNEGNLLIQTNFGELMHKHPISYQKIDGKRVTVESSFKKTGPNSYGFKLGKYDRNHELVIDPVVMAYSTYLGGWKSDEAHDITVGSNGYVYVTGKTSSNDFPLINQYQNPQGDNFDFDAFISVFDPTQSGSSSLIYSTYISGSGEESAESIDVDSNGYIYITGTTGSTDFPVINAYQGTKGYGSTLYALKIDPTQGSSGLLYSTFITASSNTYGIAIDANNNGKAYVLGSTQASDFPLVNEYRSTCSDTDMTVSVFDTTLSGVQSLTYSTYLGAGNNDYPVDLVIDSHGYVYIAGSRSDSGFPLVNQYQSAQGSQDTIVAKLDITLGTSGLIYSTYLGGTGADRVNGIAVDNNGILYLTGYTTSTNFPTLNPYQTDQTTTDAYITKLDTTKSGNSSLVYSTYFGGSGEDEGVDIDIDSNGNLVIAGKTYSNNLTLVNQYQSFQASMDTFVLKMDLQPDGTYTPVFSSYLGGDNWDWPYGVELDESNNIYVAGFTVSTNFPTLNELHGDKDTGYDGFVSKFSIQSLPTVTTAAISDITYTTASSGGEVTSDGNATVTARGICWSTAQDPTISDDHTTDGSGTGTFTSSISNLNPNSTYYVRAYATNSVGTSYGQERTILTLTPSITVTSPDGGESWQIASSQTITWTSSGVTGNIKIEYSSNNGDNWNTIIDSTENDGSHSWTIPNDVSGQCLVNISDTTGSTTDTSNAVFSITPLPSITVLTPNGGEAWATGSTHSITWDATAITGDVIIDLYKNNVLIATIGTTTATDENLAWTIPFDRTIGNDYQVRIYQDNISDYSDTNFSINYPPLSPLVKPDFNNDGQDDILWRYYGVGGYNCIWLYGTAASLPSSAQNSETNDINSFIPLVFDDFESTSLQGQILDNDKMDITIDELRARGIPDGFEDYELPINNQPDSLSDPFASDNGKDISNKMSTTVTDPRDDAEAVNLPSAVKTEWSLCGTGDFNGDGKPDLVWRHNGLGLNSIWFMDGVSRIGVASLPTTPLADWKICGTGDFNGDGQVDLVWRNTSQGINSIWYMNGINRIGVAALPSAVNLDWSLCGTGDINNDGQVDLIWRHYGLGLNSVWIMNGTSRIGVGSLPSTSILDWILSGTGDFNNDGKLDILWRNSSSGLNAIWFMNGFNRIGSKALTTVTDTDWQIEN